MPVHAQNSLLSGGEGSYTGSKAMTPSAPDPGTQKAEVCSPAAADGAAARSAMDRMMEALEGVESALRSREERVHWFQNAALPRYSIGPESKGGKSGLLAWLGGGLSALRPGFDEDAYLYFNPDVAAAISGGGLNSAYEHWTRNGRREGRAGGEPMAVASRGRVEGPAGLNVYGFLSSVSGLGVGARGIRKSIEASGLAGEYFDLPNWEDGARGSVGVRRGKYRTNLLLQNSDVLPLFVRTYGQDLLEGRYNIAHCAWELASLRADSAESLRYVDEIWTVSEFTRAAYQAATPLPVRVVPNTVDGLDEVATLSRAELGLPEGVFLFTAVFDVSSGYERKNPLALLEAFRSEFRDAREVFLLLKCMNERYNPGPLEKLRRRAAADNIGLVTEVWTDAQIHSLHRVTDCLVSTHRSEGFGLNMAEAMYFGNAVVGTNYGGNRDFMDESNSYPAAYRLVELKESTGAYLKGNVWAEVDVGDVARQMRRAFEDTAERRKRGQAAARTIREKYSATAVGRLIRERLAEIDQPVVGHPARPERFLPKQAPGRVRAVVHQLGARPRISLITPVHNVDGAWLQRCVDSVRAQWYPYWDLCLCDDGSTREETMAALAAYQGVDPRIKVILGEGQRGTAAASNRAAEFATGEWLAMLDQGDELAPDALLCVARAVAGQPELDVLYTDEDKIDEAGQHVDHYYKPDWSPEHLQSVMYLQHMLVVRKRLFWEAGGFRPEMDGARDYDLALRLAGRTNRIGHVPKVLYHWRKTADSAAAPEAGQRALEDFVRREKLPATVEPGLLPGLYRVRYRVVGRPKATLVIVAGNEDAERARSGGVEPVENFARSIVEKTAYTHYEILVAHDGGLRLETAGRLARMGCRLEEYPGPRKAFSRAHKANWSLRQARTNLVVLLNDDMEVADGAWLEALLEYAQQPWIGAVGGKLVDPDGRLQHAGVVLGAGDGRWATHPYYGSPRDFVGYNAYTHVVRNYSAVTDACLATRMSVFEEMGGFNERYGVDYSGTDYCLSLLERGYRVVYTPYSELYRLKEQCMPRKGRTTAEADRFGAKWAKYVEADPHYNVNLSRTRLYSARGDGGG